MKIEKKIKEKYLFEGNFITKNIYFFFNKYISKFVSFRKSYSQGAMDLILDTILKKKDSGVYVDVGCQHPIKNNNTYLLFKRGWSGVNIDLDKFNIELFKFNRPRDYNVNKAVSDKKEIVDLYFYHQKSPINTLNKKISELQNDSVSEIKKMETETLSSILDSSPYKSIDVLSIDVEGSELKVLKGLNFDKYKPKLIIVEYLDLKANKWEIPYNNFKNIQSSEIYNFLISKNYNFVNWVNGDLVFVSRHFF